MVAAPRARGSRPPSVWPVLLQQRVVHALRFREHPALAEGQPDGPCLIRDSTLHRSPNPPRCIGGEAMAAFGAKTANRLEQAERALLDEVLHRQRATCDRVGSEVGANY